MYYRNIMFGSAYIQILDLIYQAFLAYLPYFYRKPVLLKQDNGK